MKDMHTPCACPHPARLSHILTTPVHVPTWTCQTGADMYRTEEIPVPTRGLETIFAQNKVCMQAKLNCQPDDSVFLSTLD